MKVQIYRNVPLWLSFLAALVIVSWGVQALTDGQTYQWLLKTLPSVIVLCALFLVAYLHERASGWSWSRRPLSYRLRSSSLIGLYFLLATMAGVWLRNAFPPQVETAYASFYWAISGSVLIIILGLSALPTTQNVALMNGIRRGLIALLILVGIASGPIIWGWGPSPTENSPTTAIAISIWVVPMLLYYIKTFPFAPPRTT